MPSHSPLPSLPRFMTIALALFVLTALPRTTLADSTALTVYNNDFAVVKEMRTLLLSDKVATVKFTDVAKRIDPTSVHFKSLTDPTGTRVLEQNYEYDLVGADKLLSKYIDRELNVTTQDGRSYRGALLSFDRSQLVIQGVDGKLYMVQRQDNITDIKFEALPEGLLTKPTLVWKLATKKPGEHKTQVAYQTSGLSWHADYNVVLNEDDTEMDMTGWVTINNQSGASYKDAKIKLIAGDVRKVQPIPSPTPQSVRIKELAFAEVADAGFEQQSFFEYHLYTLGRPSTVNENQVKQIELLTAARVPVTKRYVFEPNGRYWHRKYGDKNLYKVNVFIELTNDEKSNLGMPLPKGKVRVYKQAPPAPGAPGIAGRFVKDLEFVGEDKIDHTPRDEQVKLYIGDAFDLVGEKKILKHRNERRWRQQVIQITLRNHKEDAANIVVREHLGQGNWTISDQSHPFKKDDAKTVEFVVPVAARGASVLTYTVDYRW